MVKCSDCGMLAVSNGAGAIVTAPPITRQHGQFMSGSGSLCCAMNACNHLEEFASLDQPQHQDEKKWLEVIETPRECTRYLSWCKGLELADHWELKRMLELEKMNEERRRRDLAFAASQRRASQRFHAGQKRWDRITQISNTVVNILLSAAIGALLVWLGFKKP